MTQNELVQIIEGVLLASAERVTIKQLQSLFLAEKLTLDDVESALQTLERHCQNRSYELKQVDNGYYFQVKASIAPWIQALRQHSPPKQSKALLETLSIIAHQQPVTRGEIEAVRGVSVSSQIMKTLLDSGWVKAAGQKPIPGRPTLFVTTPEFLMHFGLSDLHQFSSVMIHQLPAET